MVHPILSTKAAAVASSNASAGGNGNASGQGNNISIFKNFIQQYQSHGSAVSSVKNAVTSGPHTGSAQPNPVMTPGGSAGLKHSL